MLALTRLPGERLCIGDGITVEVLSVFGDKVRLGVVAPPAVEVDREEVRRRKDRERAARPATKQSERAGAALGK